ncbi:hypothetical protein ILUMI_17867, partial [Ignelater luminosus]
YLQECTGVYPACFRERKKKCTRPTSSHSHLDKNEQPNSFGKAESTVANGTASPGC